MTLSGRRLDTRYLKMLKKSITPHLSPLPNGERDGVRGIERRLNFGNPSICNKKSQAG